MLAWKLSAVLFSTLRAGAAVRPGSGGNGSVNILTEFVLVRCMWSELSSACFALTSGTSQRARQLLEEGVTTGRPALAEPGTPI